MLKNQTAERLAVLTGARTQLSECVKTLERMDETHGERIANLRETIEAKDAAYDRRLAELSEEHTYTSTALKKQVREAEKKLKVAQHSMKKAEKEFQEKMNNAKVENELLKTELSHVQSVAANRRRSVNPPPDTEVKIAHLRNEMERKEEMVAHLRDEGQRLTREIARINHETALAKRRAALGLIR
jgi:chromosome segregation ATPase